MSRHKKTSLEQPQENSTEQVAIGSFFLRVCFLVILTFIIFAVLIIRLWQMQILHHEEYVYKEQKQYARRIRLPSTRGNILAFDGTQIVRNRPSYNLSFHPEEIHTPRISDRAKILFNEIKTVSDTLGCEIPISELDVQKHLNMKPGLPLTIFHDLKEQDIARIGDIYPPISGMEVTVEPLREYPFDSLAAHIIGYVGYEDPTKEQDRSAYFYYLAGMQGREGLEAKYDNILAGTPGSKLVMVNSSGFIHQEIGDTIPAKNGFDIRLTLDLKAQQALEKAISSIVGSMVILDAESGAVVAMGSSPTFSPALFVPSISREDFAKLRDDPNKPFLNRSTMGAYMPGSIAKPLVALAALKAGVSPDKTINCSGVAHYGYGAGVHCTATYGHGPMDMREAITRSCNVYFVDMGCDLGIDKLSSMYASAGIGRKTGIEIAERTGLLPVNSRNWNINETAYISIGQGRIEVTPLQAALWFAAIANGGTIWKPYLVSDIYENDPATGERTIVKTTHPLKAGRLDSTEEQLKIIREGMYLVVHDRNGTGKRANVEGAEVYGKTGTADVTGNPDIKKNTWFGGFVRNPKDNKYYSFALIVENGASGGGTAAPIVADALSLWFDLQ